MKPAPNIARLVLDRLAELGLPSTLENYSRYFREITGAFPQAAPPGETSSPVADSEGPFSGHVSGLPVADSVFGLSVVEAARKIVDTVSQAADDLAKNIGDPNREIKPSPEILARAQEHKQILALLGSVIATANAMHRTVEQLIQARQALDQLRVELNANQALLHQDPLTGILNRRGMDDLLAREAARSRRVSGALAVAMIDLDHFKQINDSRGHSAGDRTLIHFVEVAKSMLRETDVLVRYGGEEFLVILPETDVASAEGVIERFKQAIAQTPLILEGKQISFTFSAGIAQLRAGENSHGLVLRADQALYEAKQAGRDCIIIAGP